jgi:hypothetical protein
VFYEFANFYKEPKMTDKNERAKNRRELIAEELEQAAGLLREGVVLESVAWRFADAAADFVALVERRGLRKVPGVHEHSGKGGKLVRKTP